jgi:MOSC domain-containing protein YiiM
MKLLSVNVGQPRPSPWASVKVTGIDKRSVDGPVMVTPVPAKGIVGLAGDRVYDVRHHGGRHAPHREEAGHDHEG